MAEMILCVKNNGCKKCTEGQFHFCPPSGDYLYPRFSCCGILFNPDDLNKHSCKNIGRIRFFHSSCLYEDCKIKGSHYCELNFVQICCNSESTEYYSEKKGRGYECKVCGNMVQTCTECGGKLDNPWRRYHGKCLKEANDTFKCIYCNRKRERHLADLSDSDCSCDNYDER